MSMTPEEQRALLLECDAQEYKVESGNDRARINYFFEVSMQELDAYTAAVEAKERERCAEMFKGQYTYSCPWTNISKAIRSLK